MTIPDLIAEKPQTAQDPTSGPADAGSSTVARRDWLALAALTFATFMMVVDATIVNVALPSIRHDLNFTPGGLTWVVNGYILTASGLLLVGGRIGDLFGRRRMFLTGTVIFAVASLTAGLAGTAWVLVASRFAQGAGEALMAPAATSLIALLFRDDKSRAKAFGILGGVAGIAAVSGVVLSGLLTDLASWRLVFLINVPVSIVPLVLVPRLVKESRAPQRIRPVDLIAGLLVTAGLMSVVYGLLNSSQHAWASLPVAGPLAAGAVALAVFIALQARAEEPLVPLRFFANQVRASGTLSIAFLSSASAAVFFLIVLYTQDVLGYSPLLSGLAWLPFCAAFLPGLMLSTRIINKSGSRTALIVGLACAGGGVLLLSRIPVDGNFLLDLVPAMLITAFGFGITNPALQHAAMHGVSERDAGLGAGVATTVMQMGGAVGLAVFVTIALRRQDALEAAGTEHLAAVTAGTEIALRIAAIVLILGAVVTAALMPRRDMPSVSRPIAEPAA